MILTLSFFVRTDVEHQQRQFCESLYNKMYLKNTIYPLLRRKQAGFTPGRSWSHQRERSIGLFLKKELSIVVEEELEKIIVNFCIIFQ